MTILPEVAKERIRNLAQDSYDQGQYDLILSIIDAGFYTLSQQDMKTVIMGLKNTLRNPSNGD